MKIIIFSEDFRDGMTVDWPVVPRIGEFVSFRYQGGTLKHRAESIDYVTDENHSLTYVAVHIDI